MRIAFLTDTYWPRINGVTVSTDTFRRQLEARGHQVRVWAPQYGLPGTETEESEPDVQRFRSLTPFFSKEDRLPNPRYRREFYRQLDAFVPDLIHVQTEVSSLFVRAYSRSRRVPVVQTCHTYFEQYIAFYFPAFPPRVSQAFARWLTRQLVKTADALVAPTQAMKGVLASYGVALPISVVPTGIDEGEFQGIDQAQGEEPSPWLERWPLLRGRRVLLCVCRIAQEKNVDFLLDVMDRVRIVEPQALLVMAGAGPYLESFIALVKDRGLENHVSCLGYVGHDQIKHLYALAEVFTFASVTETQGLVTIEAMMCGTPVVAIGKMGTTEVMEGEQGGFLVDEDAQAFATAVLRLLHDPDLYQIKVNEARSWSQHWTAAAMAERIEGVYHQVSAQYQPRS